MHKRVRDEGFTLVELLVVIAIIAILASLLVAALPHVICSAKAGTSQAMLKNLEIACKEYESDFAAYPKPWNAVRVMRKDLPPLKTLMDPGKRGKPYIEFSDDQFQTDAAGRPTVRTALGNHINYRENASVPPSKKTAAMHNKHGIDLWTQGCGDPATDPTVKEALNNWGG